MIERMDFRIPAVCGMGLHFTVDGFRLVYLGIAVLMWAVAGLFSVEYMAHYEKKRRYYLFFWATFAATVGVFLSADLYTLFLFFEIMSFTSYVWVAFDEKKESLKAAETYLAVAVIGGMVMLMGLFLLYQLFGTLEMDALSAAAVQVLNGAGETAFIPVTDGFPSAQAQLYTAGALLLFGFCAKAGAVPLHIWLPKAHPAAPAPASALLSGILTKAGILGIILLSCTMFTADGGWNLVIAVLGLATMFAGAFLALFSANIKRTLACSSVSQIGFILTGIGMAGILAWAGEENLSAVRGTFLHMVNHSLVKLVLFLCAGVVYMNLHQLELAEIRGFGRKKPALLFAFFMGTLGIGGLPLWNGYVSKTLLHEGIAEYIELLKNGTAQFSGAGVPADLCEILVNRRFWFMAEWIFLFTGGMTVAYMLKLFFCLFVDRHPTRQAEYDAMSDSYMTPLSRFVLCGAAAVLPVLGFLPHQTMDVLADLGQPFFHASGASRTVSYLSAENLKGSLISTVIGILLCAWMFRKALGKRKAESSCYMDRWPQWMDLERLFRTILRVFLSVSLVTCRVMDQAVDGTVLLARKTTHRQQPERGKYMGGGWASWMIGNMLDRGFGLFDRLTGRRKRKGPRASYVGRMQENERSFKHIMLLVGESFSFGLMLFSIGFCATLLYLIFVSFAH